MKLRRALVAVAATAAAGPAVLLTAPSALAAGPPSVTTAPSAMATTGPEAAAPGDPKSPDATATRTATAPTSASTSQDTSQSTSTASSTVTAPAPPPTTSSTASSSPAATPGSCAVGSPLARTELHGLPGQLVAGSGWHEFTYRVSNTSTAQLPSVAAYVEVFSYRGATETSGHLRLQWYDPKARRWQDIRYRAGYFAEVRELRPGGHADARLRLAVDAKAPAGSGAAFQIGYYRTAEHGCGYSPGASYPFEVLAAGSERGDAKPAAKPAVRPAHEVNRTAPQGELAKLPANGELAHTGSSSAMPVLGALSGAAVLVGAGAVVFSRRRRTAEGGHR
ncbi:LAETG motif-containing sortase-dependent surface protein [Streptomyces orinoci]|uniref:LAETG motif-containing sortase-dependent surface protein n=1 Tax=Streptomyces orinoci TaxID=67339 RepID=A0ABV3JU22_STRON|nr:LAETG motif-containing sortase-dependent surface protein [Streptomyces orinoci]